MPSNIQEQPYRLSSPLAHSFVRVFFNPHSQSSFMLNKNTKAQQQRRRRSS